MNDNGNYEFTVSGSSLKRFLADVFGQASYSDLKYDKKLGYNQAEATADPGYGLSESDTFWNQ